MKGGTVRPSGGPEVTPVVSPSAVTLFIRYIHYWNLQFLNNVIINKTKVLLPWLILATLFRAFGLIALKTLNYLAFHSFDVESTWWRLFQKLVVHIKFDIYFIITPSFSGIRSIQYLVFGSVFHICSFFSHLGIWLSVRLPFTSCGTFKPFSMNQGK